MTIKKKSKTYSIESADKWKYDVWVSIERFQKLKQFYKSAPLDPMRYCR